MRKHVYKTLGTSMIYCPFLLVAVYLKVELIENLIEGSSTDRRIRITETVRSALQTDRSALQTYRQTEQYNRQTIEL